MLPCAISITLFPDSLLQHSCSVGMGRRTLQDAEFDILKGKGLCLQKISVDGSDLVMYALGLWS